MFQQTTKASASVSDMGGISRIGPGQTVAVGLSGGVDSHQAARILLEKGFKVLPFHLRLDAGSNSDEAARRSADHLGLKLEWLDFSREFQRDIIDYFVQEYQQGRTPSPCVKCNELFKFGLLWRAVNQMGADFLATGHYAGLAPGPRPLIARPLAKDKDQSYFLCRLKPDQIARLVFPLAGLAKPQVRREAQGQGFAVPEDSQEICFIAGDYRDFLQARLGADFDRPGDFALASGQVIGRHKGVGHYTVGQRRGLGLPAAAPYYVLKIDPAANLVVLGSKTDLARSECHLSGVVLNFPAPASFRALVQIRSRRQAAAAQVDLLPGDRARVLFERPQEAIAAGQAAAVYDGDLVLGGGWID